MSDQAEKKMSLSELVGELVKEGAKVASEQAAKVGHASVEAQVTAMCLAAAKAIPDNDPEYLNALFMAGNVLRLTVQVMANNSARVSSASYVHAFGINGENYCRSILPDKPATDWRIVSCPLCLKKKEALDTHRETNGR